MSDRSVVIADSVRQFEFFYALDIWSQSFFRRLDLSKILVYFTQMVQPEVLPIIARELNLLGNKGWNFAGDELGQRALLARAAEIHRYAGTPWAIEQALAMVGITNGTVEEGAGTVGDGCDWARFQIRIDTSVGIPSSGQILDATILVNTFKNARSIFLGFVYL